MRKNSPIASVDYWPDNLNEADLLQVQPSLLRQALIFLMVFACLQIAWLLTRENAFGHFIRGDITVKPAVVMINLFTPHLHAQAFGNQIIASGGGLVIKLGCEGFETLFILLAAFASTGLRGAPLRKGMLIGTGLVYGLNQARVLLLFYVNRADKALFELSHTTIAPMLFIAIICVFFYWWLHKHQNTPLYSAT